MKPGVFEIPLKSASRNQMIDITAQVQASVGKAGVKEGICLVFAPHTTAGITINENADPDVKRDLQEALGRLAPEDAPYFHFEGNADAHIKSTIAGCSKTIPVKSGGLALGRWQGIMFCEFDGPRDRKVLVKVFEC